MNRGYEQVFLILDSHSEIADNAYALQSHRLFEWLFIIVISVVINAVSTLFGIFQKWALRWK